MNLITNVYVADLSLLAIIAVYLLYIMCRYRKQLKRVRGFFIPCFYVYAILVISLRSASCVFILFNPREFLQYITIDPMPTPHVVSILNDTAKTVLFTFGWIMVVTLYVTSQILKWAHMQEITIEQVNRRKCIISSIGGLMTAYIIFSESLMYYMWDPWSVELYAISDAACFTVLAVTYAIVVCYLFKNLTRI